MTEAYWARPEEKDEIIDFCDFVFSKSHRPHDFATLLPKLYGENGDGAAHHFIIREGGRIAAAILAYPVAVRIGSERLLSLCVGSVSTHPRARGRGYMKTLLCAVDEKAQALGADFALLGGQRQRYAYFGYVHAGYELRGTLTPDNVRHALRDVSCEGYALAPMTAADVPRAQALHARQPSHCERPGDRFMDILRSWDALPLTLTRNGEVIGFASLCPGARGCPIGELCLAGEAHTPAVLKLLSERYGELTLCAAPWERERAALLTSLCESYAISHNHSYKFYHPDRVVKACRALCCGGESLTQSGFALPLPLFIPETDCV